MLGKYPDSVSFFEALISTDNAVRAAAEQDLSSLKSSDPKLLLSSCLQVAAASPKVPVVQMALFAIKREFVVSNDEVPAEMKPQLTSVVLKVVETHGAKILMNICAEILCGIASHSKNYQDFLQDLVKICQSSDAKLRMFGLISFETMTASHLETEVLEGFASSFLTIFTQLLSDSEVGIRTQAVKTISTFLASISNPTLLLSASEVIKSLVGVMVETMKSSEDDGVATLEALTELTGMQPDIWNKYLSDIFVICSQIANAKQFQEKTRSEAIELLLIIAGNKKQEVRKLEEVKTQFFPALLQMMAEVEHKDNLAAWTADEADDTTKIDPSSSASSAVSRLAEALGGKATIALCDTHIMGYMKSEDWTHRYAGVYAIGMIAEYCRKIMMEDNVMQTILLYPLY